MKTYIGLAAVDWDHTLKFDDGISQENRQAVAELIGHRLLFTPATGRNFHHMIRDYRQLDKGGPLVTSDGALVSIADGGILSERPLPQDAAAAILEGAHKRRISCLCFHRHGIFTTTVGDWNADLERHKEIGGRFEFGSPSRMSKRRLYKPLLFSLDPAKLDDLQSHILSLFGNDVDAIRNSANTLEFVAEGVSKVSGLEVVCDYFGIDRSKTFAFGNGINDIRMFRWAGLSVCVHHGHPDARSAAKLVAPETSPTVNFAAAVELALVESGIVATTP